MEETEEGRAAKAAGKPRTMVSAARLSTADADAAGGARCACDRAGGGGWTAEGRSAMMKRTGPWLSSAINALCEPQPLINEALRRDKSKKTPQNIRCNDATKQSKGDQNLRETFMLCELEGADAALVIFSRGSSTFL